MAMVEFRLLAEVAGQGHSYVVVVDEIAGMARLNVARHSEISQNDDIIENSQGVDLTADECEALGKHLIALSERLRRIRPKSVKLKK
ncbi:MAG: hypothetical protein FJ123_09155 [Deltaproteobacteria bacterium]|nr:hypothetical protein [Deltaproteobacteria bacterium]